MNVLYRRKPLRVLVLHNSLSPYRLPLFQALSRSPGYQFQFLFPTKVAGDRQWKFGNDLGIDYRILSTKKVQFRQGILYFWINISEVVYKPDLLVLSDHLNIPEIVLQTYAKLKKIPVLRWIATTKNSLQGMLGIKIKAKALLNRIAQGILVTGSDAWDYAFKTTNRVDSIYVCSNVVDNEFFRKARTIPKDTVSELRQKYGLKGLVLSYFGRLVDNKGLTVLLRATKRVNPNLEFSILFVGDGPLRVELQKMFNLSNQHRFYITGHIDPGDLPYYYSLSDVVVLPSFIDTWGMVVNEAMASGVPVICSTGAGASRDLIRHGKSGMIFEKGDIDELSAAIELVLSSEELRKSMVKEADKILERFTIETARDQFLDAVDKTYIYAKSS